MIKSDALQILGVSLDATISEIKKSYFNLVKKFPPEQYPEKFHQIRQAYEFFKEYKKKEALAEISFVFPEHEFSLNDAYQIILEDILFQKNASDAESEFIDITKNDRLFII